MFVIKYSLFAVASTLCNLAFQFITFSIYSGYLDLYLAMFIGTLAGLIAKYILDKKYIFYHQTKGQADNAKKFLMYSFMGVFTTVIFWGTEIAFDYMFESDYAKYIGAVLGLSIGYIIKYYLDKNYVFVADEV